jgi:hypothetical protein
MEKKENVIIMKGSVVKRLKIFVTKKTRHHKYGVRVKLRVKETSIWLSTLNRFI